MWLVIDTNQARRIPRWLNIERCAGKAEGLSLPPYMMAELLPRGQAPRSETLAAFAAHRVKIGVEPSMAIEAAAQLGADDLPAFWPFPAPGDEIESDYRRLLKEDRPTVTLGLTRWAETVKRNHHAFMTGMEARGIGARQKLKELNVGTIEDFAEALKMTNGPDSFIGSLIVTTFTNGGKRKAAISDPAELVQAVLENPYFRHFYHAILYYIVSVTKLWRDPALHREPHRNDWTDLTMALYVGTGDALVTNDGLLRAVFAAIDSEVPVVSAADLSSHSIPSQHAERTMNRLNGWQRIWVVLIVMWTLVVGMFGYQGPTAVYHSIDYSEKAPTAKMAPKVRQRMTTPPWEGEACDGPVTFGMVYEEIRDLPGLSTPVRMCFPIKGISDQTQKEIEAVAARMTAARESEENIKLVVAEMQQRAAKAGYFLPKIGQDEVNRIKAEYAHAYAEELRYLRRDHYKRMALIWLIPGVMLYAFGWSIRWIWRGFKK
jgi:hypothetical protein